MQAEGLILAGGRSTRMEGLHKGNLLYRKKTFTQILETELKKGGSRVSISYGTERKEYAGECRVIMGAGDYERDLIEMFPEADVIFLEGLKDMEFPKIEVIREGISKFPVSNREGRFLIVTDRNPEDYEEETAGFGEIGQIVDRILGIIYPDKKAGKE